MGEADPELDELLNRELGAFNVRATGLDDQREVTLSLRDDDGEVCAGLSGWTWGTHAGIAMVWVREDRRGKGLGSQLLAGVERVARDRGCRRLSVSSFTFQAPDFYRRHGFVETGRLEGVPVEGQDDVHLVKLLR